MQGELPVVSVILVAYHGDAWLSACVESLAEASRERLHLVLVDNGGNTVLDQLDLSRFDVEHLRTPRPMGFAEANNFALVHANKLTDYIVFLNQDVINGDGWIDSCLARFTSFSNQLLGALSPTIRTYDGSGWDPAFLTCLRGAKVDPDDISPSNERLIVLREVPAPALIVRRDVLLRAGPFDPIFGSYYEDYDLCRRVRALGYGVGFCSDATVRHYSGSTTTDHKKELRRMRLILRNRTIHKLRSAEKGRLRLLLHWFLLDVPRRVVRAMLRRPGSQPVPVIFSASWDLVVLSWRLLNPRRDVRRWQDYLSSIGWDTSVVVEEEVLQA